MGQQSMETDRVAETEQCGEDQPPKYRHFERHSLTANLVEVRMSEAYRHGMVTIHHGMQDDVFDCS